MTLRTKAQRNRCRRREALVIAPVLQTFSLIPVRCVRISRREGHPRHCRVTGAASGPFVERVLEPFRAFLS